MSYYDLILRDLPPPPPNTLPRSISGAVILSAQHKSGEFVVRLYAVSYFPTTNYVLQYSSIDVVALLYSIKYNRVIIVMSALLPRSDSHFTYPTTLPMCPLLLLLTCSFVQKCDLVCT